ncbi:hypothetical protein MGG_06429 [Pyricularia oryzae 70-15]|uniref:Uncharacterized protein n=3 Tax=Pyricularia oryzae TaxID=318829 RepID=G4N7A9_PYRO7|nr:uncharacterized protein MGG_06429 [Pyricularia oryzae 70-15]EHA50819.1 hypothetical protein MGG_06429 [Pyricularia oryzae 70-15]ELQ44422.1 hypothetical protein OOU_Y34scaffold00088g62 [Pyricularia oryzae Y34]KAI7916355.1 hypothetical protein M9X92_007936 [Pyricularia oryzae]KAI7917167.1 hypothetical protein M0657_008216 [Pyricularia oryzae]
MVKRKREAAAAAQKMAEPEQQKNTKRAKAVQLSPEEPAVVIQIVTGSYDRTLHGFTATIRSGKEGDKIGFADTFLFDAHNSAVKCLALSPPSAPSPGQGQRVMLATGGTDERINIYNISAHPPKQSAEQDLISSLAPRPVAENPQNRELGMLLHHSSTITKLSFPTRSKLLSSSEDSTIAITRTRDWSLLSSIKVPIPKAYGRPSGDTAPMGGTPAGVNDFAVHPSLKVMISVSKGERSMRLWNLVTGKKAGVLNFGKDVLHEIGEAKYNMGEGRSVVWGSCDGEDEFAVAFDREVLVYGMDGTPKCRVMGSLRTKVHKVQYLQWNANKDSGKDSKKGDDVSFLAVSTEDGRICFFSTKTQDLQESKDEGKDGAKKTDHLSTAKLLGSVGGKDAGVTRRIKDFVVLPGAEKAQQKHRVIVSGSSDGKIHVWKVERNALVSSKGPIGKILGSYETQNRITCLTAFDMIPRPEGLDDEGGEDEEVESGEEVDSEDGQE